MESTTDRKNGKKPIAIALVHGIGAVDYQDMIGRLTKALEPSLPNGAKFHPWIKVFDGDGDTTSDDKICQKETQIQDPQIKVASAYWGDISYVGETVQSVLTGLLKNIFGLRYFASAALRDGGPLRHLLWLLNTAMIWLTAVITFPLNVVTLFFSIFFLISRYLALGKQNDTDIYIGALICTAIIVALSFYLIVGLLKAQKRRKKPTALHISLLTAHAVFSLAIMAIITIDYFKSPGMIDVVTSIKDFMSFYGDKFSDPRWEEILKDTKSNQYLHLIALSFSQLMAGIAVVCLAMFALPIALLSYMVSGFSLRVGRAVSLALSSSIATWLFVLLVTWPENLITNFVFRKIEAHWIEALLVVFIMLLTVAGVILWFVRKFISAARVAGPGHALEKYAPQPNGSEEPHSVAPRFIFSSLVQSILIVLMAIVIVIACTISLSASSQIASYLFTGYVEKYFLYFVKEYAALINFGALLMIGVFVLTTPVFRYGAKTLLDIVNHFKLPQRDYPIRQAISQRFRQTVEYLVETTDKPELIIISHSQGTIVAWDALQDEQFQARLVPHVSSVTLLTFGSPLQHIYRHYFHNHYQNEPSESFKRFASAVDFRWTNVYRCDDYVGTFILGSPDLPVDNVPLENGGHVDYWRPEIFAQLVREGKVFR